LYHVRLLDPETETEGGLALPEVAQGNRSDAIVLAAGEGRKFENNERHLMNAQAGDRVVFLPHALRELEPREGCVHDAELLAVLPGPDHMAIVPANSYLLVKPDRDEATFDGGLIVKPDSARKQPCHGVVVSWGPGEVRTKGPLAATRHTVPQALNHFPAEDGPLEGARIHWMPSAQTVDLSDDRGTHFALVHAGDCFAVEIP